MAEKITPEQVNAALHSAAQFVNMTFPQPFMGAGVSQPQNLHAYTELKKAAVAEAFKLILSGQSPLEAIQPKPNVNKEPTT